MTRNNKIPSPSRPTRRAFLADAGLGFTGLALSAMLARDGIGTEPGAWQPPDGLPHFAPRAKRVIWLFMRGGVSHMESFDPKPALDQYAGKRSTPLRSRASRIPSD